MQLIILLSIINIVCGVILYKNYKSSKDDFLLFLFLMIVMLSTLLILADMSYNKPDCPEYEPVELHLYKLKE